MSYFAIAAVQMRIGFGSNVDAMLSRIDAIAALYPWVQMIVFSELAPHGPGLESAEPLPGLSEHRFQEAASRHGLWLLPGSLYERLDRQIYNTAPVIAPDGHVVERYRKMFPFLPYEVGVSAGDRFVVFDVPEVGRFGVSICYDMWFPETTRTLALMGAEVILHPSLTPTIDRDVEIAIARSAAVTNQCYFVDVNGIGDGGVGRSVVVGPAGDVLHQAGDGPEVIPIELDLDRVRRGRERGLRCLGQPLKSFRDRKVDLLAYREPERFPYVHSLGPLAKPSRSRSEALVAAAPHPPGAGKETES